MFVQILVIGKDCPRLEQALAESYKNESLRSDATLKSYYEELTNITGQLMKTVTDVEFLYNTLEIEVRFSKLLFERFLFSGLSFGSLDFYR